MASSTTTVPSAPSRQAGEVPLALWPVAQISEHHQRLGRYRPDSSKSPSRMLPELARRIVGEYSRPGGLVLDPFAIDGTTLVEAAALGRRAVGFEFEQRWLDAAAENVECALAPRQRSLIELRLGAPAELDHIADDLYGRVDLVCTSPPRPRAVGVKYESLVQRMYAQCFSLLRPGGVLAIVTKNERRRGRTVDYAGLTVAVAREVGFRYLQHVIAIQVEIRDGELVERPTVHGRTGVRKSKRQGDVVRSVAHEDVLILRKPESPGRSRPSRLRTQGATSVAPTKGVARVH